MDWIFILSVGCSEHNLSFIELVPLYQTCLYFRNMLGSRPFLSCLFGSSQKNEQGQLELRPAALKDTVNWESYSVWFWLCQMGIKKDINSISEEDKSIFVSIREQKCEHVDFKTSYSKTSIRAVVLNTSWLRLIRRKNAEDDSNSIISSNLLNDGISYLRISSSAELIPGALIDLGRKINNPVENESVLTVLISTETKGDIGCIIPPEELVNCANFDYNSKSDTELCMKAAHLITLRFSRGEWDFYVSNANGIDFLVKIKEAMSGYKANKSTKSLRLSGSGSGSDNDVKNQIGNLAPVIPIIPVSNVTSTVNNHVHLHEQARNKPATTRKFVPFCESCKKRGHTAQECIHRCTRRKCVGLQIHDNNHCPNKRPNHARQFRMG